MAEGQRLTVAQVVAQTRDGRLEAFVREAVVLAAGGEKQGGSGRPDRALLSFSYACHRANAPFRTTGTPGFPGG